jgi:deoxyxylulose-5-phosphate synthase
MSEVKKQRERVIVAGDGNISFGMGYESIIKLPFIMIDVLNDTKEVGEDVLSDESEEVLTILFKNLKSLEVLEKMCGEVRKYLENKEENLVVKE